jgi:hypothetical protein
MPFHHPPRPSSVLAGVLAAGLMLTVASCGHITPLGPEPPQPSHLPAPFVLQAMRLEPPTPAGGCPAGFPDPDTNPGMCARPLGTPVTITSAAVSPLSSYQPQSPPGQPPGPSTYQFMITLPAADMPALTAVTTTAADVQGPLSITVAGRTWLLGIVGQPFTTPQLPISLLSGSQTVQLQHTLTASG